MGQPNYTVFLCICTDAEVLPWFLPTDVKEKVVMISNHHRLCRSRESLTEYCRLQPGCTQVGRWEQSSQYDGAAYFRSLGRWLRS